MLPERLRRAHDGRVVDQQIDRAQQSFRLGDPSLNIALLRDVADQCQPADLVGNRPNQRLGTSRDRDPHPRRRQLARDRGADATPPTGDQPHLTIQPRHGVETVQHRRARTGRRANRRA